MPRKVVLDDKIEDVRDTRIWKVLEYYVDTFGGTGLSANAICYLTEQPWKVVRKVFTERTGEHQIGGLYCYDVHAPVFYPWYGFGGYQHNQLLSNSPKLIDAADKIIAKYPPRWYPGATNDAGQKVLTFHPIDGTEENEDYCGDPECCPPPTKADSRKQKKQNESLIKELKLSWKEKA